MPPTSRPHKLYEQFEPQERLVLMLEASARGDEAEAERIRGSCPRKTYSGPDSDFDDRRSMVLDIAMAACGDMNGLVRQLRLLKCVKEELERRLVLHHANAKLAFTEGIRCVHGQPSSPFFTCFTPGSDEGEDGPGQAGEGRGPENGQDLAQDIPAQHAGLAERIEGVVARSQFTTELIVEPLDEIAEELARELAGIWWAFGRFCTSRVGMAPEKVLDGCGYPQRQQLSEILARYSHVAPDPDSGDRYREMLCRVWDGWFGDR